MIIANWATFFTSEDLGGMGPRQYVPAISVCQFATAIIVQALQPVFEEMLQGSFYQGV